MDLEDIADPNLFISVLEIVKSIVQNPWQLILLVVAAILSWRLPQLIKAFNQRRAIDRKYDVKLQKSRDKLEMIREKQKRKRKGAKK